MTAAGILGDLFHGRVLAAFVEQAIEQQGPPAVEPARRRAFASDEEGLSPRNAYRERRPEPPGTPNEGRHGQRRE